MNDIDARVTMSKTRYRVEGVSDKGKTWLEENLHRTGPECAYSLGHFQGGRVHQDMLQAGMTLHVIEVRHHRE